MALKTYYVGTTGPFYIDDTDPLYNDPSQVALQSMLDGIAAPGATVSDETTYGISPDAGISDDYSRSDHTHGTPGAPSIPVAGTTVVTETSFGQSSSAGTSADYSRKDHTHGTPANPVSGVTQDITVITAVGPPVVSATLHFVNGLLDSVT